MGDLTSEEEEIVKSNVSKWLELSREIKGYKKKVGEMQSALKLIENEIIRCMKEKDVPEFELPNGKSLKLKRQNTKKNVTPKWTKEKLVDCLNNGSPDDVTKEMINNIIKKIESPSITGVTEKLDYDGIR